MHTSAGALRNLLISVSKEQPKGKETLSSMLSKIFNLKGDEGEFESVARVIKLARTVQKDINDSSFDDAAKKALIESFQPFKGLGSFIYYSKPRQQLDNEVLNETNLNRLYTIDMALDGKSNRFSDESAQSDISKGFSDCRDEVLNSDLPNELKQALDRRLSVIIASLSHFRIWGADGLKDALTILVGEVVLNTDSSIRKKNQSLFNSLGEKIKQGAVYLRTAAEMAKNSNVIVDQSADIIGSLEDLTEKF